MSHIRSRSVLCIFAFDFGLCVLLHRMMQCAVPVRLRYSLMEVHIFVVAAATIDDNFSFSVVCCAVFRVGSFFFVFFFSSLYYVVAFDSLLPKFGSFVNSLFLSVFVSFFPLD